MSEACSEKHYIFGKSNIDKIAAKHNIDLLCKMPINSNLPGGANLDILKPILKKLEAIANENRSNV